MVSPICDARAGDRGEWDARGDYDGHPRFGEGAEYLFANASGQIDFLMTRSGIYGGTGSQDGAVANALVLSSVSAVPEPSTYAAIFGVVALGFAAYRRRKNSV